MDICNALKWIANENKSSKGMETRIPPSPSLTPPLREHDPAGGTAERGRHCEGRVCGHPYLL